MGYLRNHSLKSLSKQMELIAKSFFSESSNLKKKGFKDVEALDTRLAFKKRVNDAYRSLDSTEQLFINNEYFYENYPGWWKSLFSRDDYRKLKRRALTHFLKVFYEED